MSIPKTLFRRRKKILESNLEKRSFRTFSIRRDNSLSNKLIPLSMILAMLKELKLIQSLNLINKALIVTLLINIF